MFIKTTRILLLFFVVQAGFGMLSRAWGQRIEATVETDLRTLPIDKQDKLSDFADKVQHYINSYRWNNDPWDTVVKVNIVLHLTDISQSAEERYQGQILIHNSYDIEFFDKRWRFAYQSGDVLEHRENAQDSFTSVVDFYINLILGGEFDKWGTLAGTPYYEKAKQIADYAKFGLGRYVDGWDRRIELVEELLSQQHRAYREMVDYYYYGISFVDQDNEKVRKHVAKAIERLDDILERDPDNEYAKRFIEVHHIEMMEIYRYARDKSPLKQLIVLDPDHEIAYRDALE
jgi:tetratricopeptide (TPR) repeat protein